MKIVYVNMTRKCFGIELEPFERVPETAGLELWLQKQNMLGRVLKENGVQRKRCE
jgi:hypothetical protein